MSYWECHREAQKSGNPGYIDPESGLFVMTEQTLRARGKCCGNGCRHCPFGRSLAGGNPQEQNKIYVPEGVEEIPKHAVFMFWSGGKDSYLALLSLLEQELNIVLCTTFANGMVGHQEIPIEIIQRQAEHLQLPLLMIALRSNQTYEYQIAREIQFYEPQSLAFGDLHLEGIRSWRERFFSNYSLLFPIWKISYETLINRLEQENVRVYISAVGDLMPEDCSLCIGEEYTKELYQELARYDIDPFGENGEFHTEVRFW